MNDFPTGLRMIYMTELGEPQPNKLRVVVSEASAVGPERQISETDIFGKELIITPESRHFEFLWESYVAYSVRNESFAKFDKDRPTCNSQFTERSVSAYLRFVAETTFAEELVGSVLKGPIRHWELNCLDHFLDVVSSLPPKIRQIDSN